MASDIFIFPRLLTANAVLKSCIMSTGQGRTPLRVEGGAPLFSLFKHCRPVFTQLSLDMLYLRMLE